MVQPSANWTRIDMVIEGGLYYSYQYVADENAGAPYFLVQMQGDMDGNGILYSKAYTHQRMGGAFQMMWEAPVYDELYERTVF